MSDDKIKLTKQEFEDMYQIEEPDIPKETPKEDIMIRTGKIFVKESELFTEEESEYDKTFHVDYPQEEQE